MNDSEHPEPTESYEKRLVEEVDFYVEDGLMVLTGRFLRERGYCCENGCRHCPYGFSVTHDQSR
ncbi:MAG: DUF5522 domain-containing protein [Pyrinomonadaceae bacterium]